MKEEKKETVLCEQGMLQKSGHYMTILASLSINYTTIGLYKRNWRILRSSLKAAFLFQTAKSVTFNEVLIQTLWYRVIQLELSVLEFQGWQIRVTPEEDLFGFLPFGFSILITYWMNRIKANCFEGCNVQNLHFSP